MPDSFGVGCLVKPFYEVDERDVTFDIRAAPSKVVRAKIPLPLELSEAFVHAMFRFLRNERCKFNVRTRSDCPVC